MTERTDTTVTPGTAQRRQGRTPDRPTDTRSDEPAAEIPADVPARLSTGDVCAVLGMSRDQVRHHVRMGRLDPIVDHGYNTWRKYAPEDVVTLAEQAGITPDWSKVTR